ncbi:MAG: 16S rRNA (cytosine(1402)-N(4))-methyltransferase RsmH [Candidatus Magasanikbacteria bacterium]|nr:16S rRNA (cytosine(1402)-N(4))-methyltransferase RsmH [Candidatus Magasanikbacteria bacterium]
MPHVPVLASEVITALQLCSGMLVVDCTLGDGGHAEAILEAIGPNGKLLGLDADAESLARAGKRLARFRKQITLVNDNFAHLEKIIQQQKFGPVNAILMDLGWSSTQFAESGRGFSFQGDEPLDMRYDPGMTRETAAEIVNRFSEPELMKIFKQYGEEKFSQAIAAAIVKERQRLPIARTGQLTEIILAVYRNQLKSKKEVPWVGGLHPATKIFQALRIAVNHELEALRQALPPAVAALAPSGRLAIITFHSLEDRIVKQWFAAAARREEVKLITKKPLVPSAAEIAANPRARSAKLRVVEKVVARSR